MEAGYPTVTARRSKGWTRRIEETERKLAANYCDCNSIVYVLCGVSQYYYKADLLTVCT